MTQVPEDTRLEKLTAYALGELDDAYRGQVEGWLAANAAGRAEVEEIRRLARLLEEGLAAEEAPRLTLVQREQLEAAARSAGRRRVAVRAIWVRGGLVAAAAGVLIGTGLAIWLALGGAGRGQAGRNGAIAHKAPGSSGNEANEYRITSTPRNIFPMCDLGMSAAPTHALPAIFDDSGERPFLSAAGQAVSTLPVAAGGTSYAEAYQALVEEGRWPDRRAIRIGELINAVPYAYAGPPEGGQHLLAVHADVTGCPWDAAHRLLRVAVKARGRSARFDVLPEAREVYAAEAAQTLVAAATNVRIDVAFDPAGVSAYRLMGYERPMGPAGEAGDDDLGAAVGPGHALTVLYEIIPAAGRGEAMGTVRVGYVPAGQEAARTLAISVRDDGGAMAAADADFRFAAAVAALGMILRNSSHRGTATLAMVLAAARPAVGDDPFAYRSEFIRMVEAAQRLQPAPPTR